MTTPHPLLKVAPEVARALAGGAPVVALESTIISHGMPWPQNVQTALDVEAEVRAQGAVPATVAVIDGRLRAGLSGDQIERLGRAANDRGDGVVREQSEEHGPRLCCVPGRPEGEGDARAVATAGAPVGVQREGRCLQAHGPFSTTR